MSRTTQHYHKRAAKILRDIHYATLATVCPDGQPWNSPVFALHDNQACIYWISDKQGQHSKNIRHNGQVFIVIYDSTVPEGQGEGVYIKARVEELNKAEDIRRIRYIKKGKDGDDPTQFMGKGVRRVYKAAPVAMWMNDAQIDNGVFVRDYRVKLSLAQIRRRLSTR